MSEREARPFDDAIPPNILRIFHEITGCQQEVMNLAVGTDCAGEVQERLFACGDLVNNLRALVGQLCREKEVALPGVPIRVCPACGNLGAIPTVVSKV